MLSSMMKSMLLLMLNDYDYVIGSIHVIHQSEFYDPADFFKGKTKEEAHQEFFENTLECVQKFDCFNCLGHLDYICRYGLMLINKSIIKDIKALLMIFFKH